MSEQMKPAVQQIPVTANVLPICAGCLCRKDVMKSQIIYANFAAFETFSQIECEHIKLCEYIANRAIEYHAEHK